MENAAPVNFHGTWLRVVDSDELYKNAGGEKGRGEKDTGINAAGYSPCASGGEPETT